MITVLVISQWLLLATQVYVAVSAALKDENLLKYYNGYGVWACLPIAIIALVVAVAEVAYV